MRRLPFLLAAFLTACSGDVQNPGSPDSAPPSPPDATPPSPPDAAPPDAAPVATIDCNSLPAQAVSSDLLEDFIPTEDIAFDSAGNVIESDTFAIYKTTKQGQRTTFVPNFEF